MTPTLRLPNSPSPSSSRTGSRLALAPAGGRTFKAGDQPEFTLTALNTTSQPASASVCVTMTATAPVNKLSRAIPMPLVLWRHEQIVSLLPNETKLYALSAKTNLPPISVISLSLQDLDQKPPPCRRESWHSVSPRSLKGRCRQ